MFCFSDPNMESQNDETRPPFLLKKKGSRNKGHFETHKTPDRPRLAEGPSRRSERHWCTKIMARHTFTTVEHVVGQTFDPVTSEQLVPIPVVHSCSSRLKWSFPPEASNDLFLKSAPHPALAHVTAKLFEAVSSWIHPVRAPPLVINSVRLLAWALTLEQVGELLDYLKRGKNEGHAWSVLVVGTGS